MKVLSIGLICVGFMLLAKSVHPLARLSNNDRNSHWKYLRTLNIVFMFGYLMLIFVTWMNDVADHVNLTIAIIVSSGGVFVFLVTKLSHATIQTIAQSSKRSEYAANHDFLTNLPNRLCFLRTLESRVIQHSPFYLMCFDLNKFKQVNDGLGHHQGDQLLTLLAKRLQMNFSAQATLFRIGGDEFTVIIEGGEILDLEATLACTQSSLSVPFTLDGQQINIGCSIGISRYPDDGLSPGELLKHADLAMYESKRTNTAATFYRTELASDAAAKLALTHRLHIAIEQQHFAIHYQPIVNKDHYSLYGVEALIRWQDTDGQYISPDVFIGIAEQSNLMKDITQWVLNQVVSDIPQMKKHGFIGAVHVNLSANDFRDDLLVDLLDQWVSQGRISPDCLVFEVTESAMLVDIENVKRVMLALGKIGFKFSIDDFGTGFSSLSLLRELPVHQIKIDRSFVDSMDTLPANYTIVESAIFLSKGLHCSVVAEGVETQSINDKLVEMDCDHLQGYLHGRPQPLTEHIRSSIERGLMSA